MQKSKEKVKIFANAVATRLGDPAGSMSRPVELEFGALIRHLGEERVAKIVNWQGGGTSVDVLMQQIRRLTNVQ